MKKSLNSIRNLMLGNFRTTSSAAKVLAAATLAFGLSLGGCASDASIRSLAANTNGKLLARPDRMVRNTDVQQYVNKLAGVVLDGAKEHRKIDPEKDQWVYDRFNAVVVLDKSVNAFVTGDDTVYVHSGLIRELKHPDQLVAVLTHELAHIEQRHLADNINRKNLNGALAVGSIVGAVVGGNIGRGVVLGTAGGSLANSVLGTQFNKQQELSADRSGVELFAAMGFDPTHFGEVFEILKKRYGDGPGGSHPTNSDRLAHLKKVPLPTSPIGATRTLDLSEFQRIQELVKEEERWAPKDSLIADPALRSNLASCFSYLDCKDCHKH